MPSTSRTAADGVPREIERDGAVEDRRPVGIWATKRTPAGSRPISSGLQHRIAPITEVVEVRRAGTLVRHHGKPRATRDAAPLFPPSQIGGPPGVNGPGRFVARRASRSGPAAARPARVASSEKSAHHVDGRFKRSKRSGMSGRRIPNGTFAHMRPEADDEPPAGDVIEQRRLLPPARRMAERVRQHAVAEPFAGT